MSDAITTNKFVTAAEKTKLSNLSGTNTGDQTSISGNAGTATILATARTINGVSFDGSANITIADSTKVPTSTTVNGHALSSSVTVTASDVGLGSVDNTSDATKNSATTTLTNKRITPRAATLTVSTNTYTPAGDSTDLFIITGPTANFTVAAPTGTPTDGQVLKARMNATAAYAVTWNAVYISSGVATLPNAAVANKTITLGFMYDLTAAKWVLMALDEIGY